MEKSPELRDPSKHGETSWECSTNSTSSHHPQYMGSRMESRVVIGEVFALYCQHSEHPATCKHHCHWNSHWKRCFMDHSPLLEQLQYSSQANCTLIRRLCNFKSITKTSNSSLWIWRILDTQEDPENPLCGHPLNVTLETQKAWPQLSFPMLEPSNGNAPTKTSHN